MSPVAIRVIGHVFVIALVQIFALLTIASVLHPLPISNMLVAFLLAGYVVAGCGHLYAIWKSRWHAEERTIVGAAVLTAWTAPLAFVFFDATDHDLGWIMRFSGFMLALLSIGGAFVAVALGKWEFGGWPLALLSLPWGVAGYVALSTLGHARTAETTLGAWFLWIAYIGIPPLWKRLTSKTMSAG